MESVLNIRAVAFEAIVIAFAILCAYIVVAGVYYQCLLGRGLERDLGFKEGKQYLQVGRWTHDAVAIKAVVPGGTFDQAGFKAGDVLPNISHTGFFRVLHRSRGKLTELKVVDGGAGPPFYDRPFRVIRVAVPRRGQR